MQETLKKLTDTLQKFDARQIDFSEVIKEFVLFFEQIKTQAEKISPEETEEFTNRFIERAQKLIGMIRPYIDKIEIAEEKLIMTLESPDFFDPDLWAMVRNAQDRITEVTTTLLPKLSTLPKIEEVKEQESLRKKAPPKHAPRSKWMKS